MAVLAAASSSTEGLALRLGQILEDAELQVTQVIKEHKAEFQEVASKLQQQCQAVASENERLHTLFKTTSFSGHPRDSVGKETTRTKQPHGVHEQSSKPKSQNILRLIQKFEQDKESSTMAGGTINATKLNMDSITPVCTPSLAINADDADTQCHTSDIVGHRGYHFGDVPQRPVGNDFGSNTRSGNDGKNGASSNNNDRRGGSGVFEGAISIAFAGGAGCNQTDALIEHASHSNNNFYLNSGGGKTSAHNDTMDATWTEAPLLSVADSQLRSESQVFEQLFEAPVNLSTIPGDFEDSISGGECDIENGQLWFPGMQRDLVYKSTTYGNFDDTSSNGDNNSDTSQLRCSSILRGGPAQRHLDRHVLEALIDSAQQVVACRTLKGNDSLQTTYEDNNTENCQLLSCDLAHHQLDQHVLKALVDTAQKVVDKCFKNDSCHEGAGSIGVFLHSASEFSV